MTIISHVSFDNDWLPSKFVYNAFIAKNKIKTVPTPYKCDQQHLETIIVPSRHTHTPFFLCMLYYKMKVGCRSIQWGVSWEGVAVSPIWVEEDKLHKPHTLQLNISLNSWTRKERASSTTTVSIPCYLQPWDGETRLSWANVQQTQPWLCTCQGCGIDTVPGAGPVPEHSWNLSSPISLTYPNWPISVF